MFEKVDEFLICCGSYVRYLNTCVTARPGKNSPIGANCNTRIWYIVFGPAPRIHGNLYPTSDLTGFCSLLQTKM